VTVWHGLALALFFVLLNGWFVLAEFALVKVRTTRLRELTQEGHGRARLALFITGKLDQYLSAIQLGITLASLALGWVGEPALARLIEPALGPFTGSAVVAHAIASGIAFGLITFLHVTLGEMAPKTMAILSAERFALWVALPLHCFYVVTWPLIVVLQGASNLFVRLIGFKPASEGADPYTEEELRMIVAASHAQGVLNETTRYLLDNVLDYTTRIVREVMTPRRDVLTLDVRAPVADSIALALDREFSRYLLVDSSKDQVVGFVHVKDLVSIATGRRQVASIKEVARAPVFVPEFVPIDRVRRQLQSKKTHIGVVVDELGDYVGIVTLEDLLEELVGEIQDETDVEQPMILRQPDGSSVTIPT
jgi:CBS domain containing-hemolysin-like protein